MIRMIQCYNAMENPTMLAEPQDAARKGKKTSAAAMDAKTKGGRRKGEKFSPSGDLR